MPKLYSLRSMHVFFRGKPKLSNRDSVRRAQARLPGPMDHATGKGFRVDQSTTAAVARRMRALGVI